MNSNDIYRTATYLVRKHDADAAKEAAVRSRQMYLARDLEGLVMWKNIERAVAVLQNVANGPNG